MQTLPNSNINNVDSKVKSNFFSITEFDSISSSSLVKQFTSRKTIKNIANSLLDQVRSKIIDKQNQSCLNTFRYLEKVIVKVITLDTSFVNSYYCLAELYLQFSSSPENLYSYLSEIWKNCGCNDASSLQFIEQYKNGYPYKLPEQLRLEIRNDSLVLYMSENLDYLDILEYNFTQEQYGGLNFIGRVEYPNLICSPYDLTSLPGAKQTIIDDLIKRGKDTRIVSHCGTWVQIKNRNVFGPAIDTLYYNKVMQNSLFNNPKLLGKIKTVFEVGTGTGFLLSSVVKAFKSLPLRAIASDIDPTAIEVAKANVERIIKYECSESNIKPQITFLLNERSMEFCADGSVDLLFTNPPYIPEYCDGLEDNPYSGTRVIEDILLHNGPRILSPNGVIIVLYSSLTQKIIRNYLEKSPLIAIPLDEPRRAPLDLRELNNNPQWINFLREHHDLLEDLSHPRYVFWHSLHMLALCHKNNKHFLSQLAINNSVSTEVLA